MEFTFFVNEKVMRIIANRTDEQISTSALHSWLLKQNESICDYQKIDHKGHDPRKNLIPKLRFYNLDGNNESRKWAKWQYREDDENLRKFGSITLICVPFCA
jgi:hypothetical protein